MGADAVARCVIARWAIAARVSIWIVGEYWEC